MLDPRLRSTVPLVPLAGIILGLAAINLVLIGEWWSVMCARQLTKSRRAREARGTA